MKTDIKTHEADPSKRQAKQIRFEDFFLHVHEAKFDCNAEMMMPDQFATRGFVNKFVQSWKKRPCGPVESFLRLLRSSEEIALWRFSRTEPCLRCGRFDCFLP